MADQPNLLIIMSDQHSLHMLGSAGDPFVRTPHLDALAARGTRFERAYCGNPLCVPSRMTFLTSRHGSAIKSWTNQSILPSEIPTFAHMLGTAGYEVVHCGRMHFVGADHRHGFERHLVGDVTSQWPGTRGPALGHIPGVTTGQSRGCVEVAGRGRTVYQAFDRAVTDGAIDFLRQRKNTDRHGRRGRPFCLVVGYVLPHCPFICPKDLFDEYYDKVGVPRMDEVARANLHPALLRWREKRRVDDLSDEQVRTARAAYYGLVTMTDAFVGEVVGALGETGLAEDTAVFYTSDHGEMAGEHEMWWKSSFYEGSVGVPLIASWPGHIRQGATVANPVSLLDLGPTFTDLGHAEPIPETDGRSLVSFLRDGEVPEGWVDEVFSENVPMPRDVPSRMMVAWPWKLVHHHGYDVPQLFNLEDDPGEVNDLGSSPEHADLRNGLHARVLDGWSGEHVLASVAKEFAHWKTLRDWSRTVNPPDPDHWTEPEGCNVFPEE